MSIEEAYQFSVKVDENLNKKYDNKNSGRGHGGRSNGWSYGGQNDDKKNKDEARSSSQNEMGNTQIISMIRIIEIREEEEEGKELEEDASVEIVSIAMKKGIEHLNVLSAKEGMIEEMNGRVELQLLMKIQGHHILKMLKEEKL